MIQLPADCGYERLKQECEELAKEYQGFIKTVSIGKSWDNREIPMLILGFGQRKVLLTGGVHGRESVNPVVLVKMAERYGSLFANRCVVRGISFSDWFGKNQLLIVPLLNPDGYEIARSGFSAIQNPRLRLRCVAAAREEKREAKEWKYNGRGMDLNRNFPCKSWKRSYKGDMPASERETRALMGVFHRYKPQLYLDYHSREQSIYYYRSAREDKYNEKQKKLAMQLSWLTGYRLKKPETEIDSGDRGGNTVHYASEYAKCPALTLETVSETENFPLRTVLQQEVLRELWMTPFI